jgi:DNA-binding response OmpR family regulator
MKSLKTLQTKTNDLETPMQPEAAINIANIEDIVPHLSSGNDKVKILLVEDDFFLADIYQTKLAVEDFDVVVAQDGAEGLQKAQTEEPDLILLDIMLPKMDGLEVLKKLKADNRTKHIPVILLSNLGQEFVVKGGMNLGAVDYLLKSDLTPREVIDKIKDHIDIPKK